MKPAARQDQAAIAVAISVVVRAAAVVDPAGRMAAVVAGADVVVEISRRSSHIPRRIQTE